MAKNDVITFSEPVIVETHDDCGTGKVEVGSSNDIVRTITTFLERPHQVHSGVWSSSDAVGHELFGFTFPHNMGMLTSVMEKIARFTFLKCDCVFTVKVNATPFQQGLALARQMPLTGYSIPGDLVSMTVPSRTVCNLEEATPISFPCRFLGPLNCIDLTSDHIQDIWRFQLMVYSQLMGPTSAEKVTFQVFMRMENIELTVPNPRSVSLKLFPEYHEHLKRELRKHVGPQGLQEDQGKLGLVSGIASTVGGIASALDFIPGAGLVKTVTDTVGGIASIFGFGKTTNSDKTMIMRQQFCRSFGQGDGVDESKRYVSNTAASSVSPVPSDMDEMSITHITRSPAYLMSVEWTTAHKPGHVLVDIPVHPGVINSKIKSTPQSVPTPLAWATGPATYWTGDITYLITVVKNKFFSGLLNVMWVPGMGTGTVDINSSVRHYLDIRATSYYLVTIPYKAQLPYLPCLTTPSTYKSNGHLRIVVTNELIAQAAVAQKVQVYVEVCAGPQFALMYPNQVWYQAPKNLVAQSAPENFNYSTWQRDARAGLCNYYIEPSPLNPEIIGDPLLSVKTLLARFAKAYNMTTDQEYYLSHEEITRSEFHHRLLRSFAYYRGAIRAKIPDGYPSIAMMPSGRSSTTMGYDENGSIMNVYVPSHEKICEFEMPYISPQNVASLSQFTYVDDIDLRLNRVMYVYAQPRTSCALYVAVGDDFQATWFYTTAFYRDAARAPPTSVTVEDSLEETLL
uniref:Putative ORF2 n=1 Tax=Caledonia beadlet anemone dicistro-like virus 3 TaxID=2021909 RepID=A0A221LFB7_9VIRU|nr:putative ORF2 [Caledonia beadlet anemone dicistro-like virus 3]